MNKQKILIVDDDANIAELIALYLTKECFDTRMVHDGEMALEYCHGSNDFSKLTFKYRYGCSLNIIDNLFLVTSCEAQCIISEKTYFFSRFLMTK